MTDLCKYQLISAVSAGESDDLLDGKPYAEAVRRIQALLADSLRMENVVILTAAGCSVEVGGRLMPGPYGNDLDCLVLDAGKTLLNTTKDLFSYLHMYHIEYLHRNFGVPEE